MAAGAILAAALTDHSACYAKLMIDGLDVLLQVGGTQGQRFGVPLESIVHVERGPGGVSSLAFDLEDPAAAVSLSRNQFIRFEYPGSSPPIFQGFLTSWTPEPLQSAGRVYHCRCDGLEIVLDWAKVPALTIGITGTIADWIQMVAANCINGLAYPLNTGSSGGGSIHDFPVGGPAVPGVTALTLSAGTTLREAIRAIADSNVGNGISTTTVAVSCTVDSDGGLRVYESIDAATYFGKTPGGFLTLYVTDAQSSPANGDGTVGQPMVAEQVRYQFDATTPVAVMVYGSGVSVLVHDVTSDTEGNLAILNDTTLTTAAMCQRAGEAYLLNNRIQQRGGFSLPNKAPHMTFRGGSTIIFTDSLVGAAGAEHTAYEVERRFHGTLEDWRVTLGGAGRASFATESRRLTRSTLS